MKTYTIYLDTKTGRSQVIVEAESVVSTEAGFEFRRGQDLVAVFNRDHCYGWVEENTKGGWQEEPPELGVGT